MRFLLALSLAFPLPPVLPLSIAPSARSRLELREELLRLLPPPSSPLVSPSLSPLVEALERHATPPATSPFLLLGLEGEWTHRLHAPPPDAPPPPRAAGLARLDSVTQTFSEGLVRTTAAFHVPSLPSLSASASPPSPSPPHALSGVLAVEAEVFPTTRPDMLHLRSRGHTLSLDRSPPDDFDLPRMMGELVHSLGVEFRAEAGVVLGVQITYLDERLRVSRCTTRDLAGFCTVHTRA